MLSSDRIGARYDVALSYSESRPTVVIEFHSFWNCIAVVTQNYSIHVDGDNEILKSQFSTNYKHRNNSITVTSFTHFPDSITVWWTREIFNFVCVYAKLCSANVSLSDDIACINRIFMSIFNMHHAAELCDEVQTTWNFVLSLIFAIYWSKRQSNNMYSRLFICWLMSTLHGNQIKSVDIAIARL